jgi:hypothetical protein
LSLRLPSGRRASVAQRGRQGYLHGEGFQLGFLDLPGLFAATFSVVSKSAGAEPAASLACQKHCEIVQ